MRLRNIIFAGLASVLVSAAAATTAVASPSAATSVSSQSTAVGRATVAAGNLSRAVDRVGAEPRSPFGRCSIIHWERKSTTTIRIYAFSDDLKKYFPVDDPYGLLWITIHDANMNLKYSEAHNVSRWRQFDQNFTARKGWRVSVSLTNDTNTETLCTGGATV